MGDCRRRAARRELWWPAGIAGACLAVAGLAPRALAAQAALPRLPLTAYPTDTREAVEPLLKAAADSPADGAAAGALGRTLQAWQQWDAAHEAFRRAQLLEPETFEWAYRDGLVLQRQARHVEAASPLRRALELKPGYLPAMVRLAESLLDSGALDESERLLRELLREPVAETFGRFGLGRIAASRGDHAAAIPHFERAIELFPEWGEAHYALAMSYLAAKRRADAANALGRHARFRNTVPVLDDPVLSETAPLRDDAVTMLERGVSLKLAGDLPGAIAAHEAAVARSPGYAQAHANLISLYAQAADWAQVEEHYRAVVSLGFGLADANFDYGQAQERQERWPEAEAAYRRAIAANPGHTGARVRLGRELERQKKFDAAAAEFQAAVATRPMDRVARYDLGRMLMALGRPQDAVREFEKTIEPPDETTPHCLLGLALAHALAGQELEAARRFEEARKLATAYGQPDVLRAIAEVRRSMPGTRR